MKQNYFFYKKIISVDILDIIKFNYVYIYITSNNINY